MPVSVSLKTLINWIYGAPAAYCIISVCVDSFPLLKPRNDDTTILETIEVNCLKCYELYSLIVLLICTVKPISVIFF